MLYGQATLGRFVTTGEVVTTLQDVQLHLYADLQPNIPALRTNPMWTLVRRHCLVVLLLALSSLCYAQDALSGEHTADYMSLLPMAQPMFGSFYSVPRAPLTLTAKPQSTARLVSDSRADAAGSSRLEADRSKEPRRIGSNQASQFGKVRKTKIIVDYVVLRAATSFQHHAYRQDDEEAIHSKHRSEGIDFDYEEFQITADLEDFRLGGTVYGAQGSGAQVFGEWPVAQGSYLGLGLAGITSRTHQERYQAGETLSESNRQKWNTYALSSYLLQTARHYEFSGGLGLSRKRRTFKESSVQAAKTTVAEDLHLDFRSWFVEARASLVVPINSSIDLLWSYSYYKERMYKGTKLKNSVKSAVDGTIENHYFDLLHLRFSH